MSTDQKMRPRAVVVGGSIAGVSCAHALLSAGWDVIVLEKSRRPPSGSPTGAGVGVDPLAQSIIGSWLGQPEALRNISLPLTVHLNQAINNGKISRVLTREDRFNHRAVHWAALHGLLYSALPPENFLWGHVFVSVSVTGHRCIRVRVKDLRTEEIIEIDGDLLVGADGCLSTVRRNFLSDLKLRYSGYYAWRGVLDYSRIQNSETIQQLKRTYPELGECLYFDLAPGTHTLLFELPNKMLNWMWYINHPEPELKGNSVTMRVSNDMVEKMYKEAEKIWPPEFVMIMKLTEQPFINVIYDHDPLEQVFWDKTVLVGEAAHPTTPHCARSTNMSIVDAAVLGMCLGKWGPGNLGSALREYQSIRLGATSEQVLCSRRIGRIKQGLAVHEGRMSDPNRADTEDIEAIHPKNLPFFEDVSLNVKVVMSSL